MPRSFIIDTDTASDDAVALLMALRHPDVRVEAITVVAGNVELEQGLKNALYTVELSGADVPVYRGSAAPLRRELVVAQFFHGRDGLGDQGYPSPQRKPAEGDAVDVLIETIRAQPGIVLVTLGPLTNVARALSRAPDIVSDVGRCIVMGGAACTIGNVTPAAEYNVWVDPDAARVVFRSGLPIEMIGWELCRGAATLSEEEMDRVQLSSSRPSFNLHEVCLACATKLDILLKISLSFNMFSIRWWAVRESTPSASSTIHRLSSTVRLLNELGS